MPKVKYKEKNLKAAREKQIITYKGTLIWLAAESSRETMQDRRAWQKIFKKTKTEDINQEYFIQQSYHLELKDR